MGLLNRLSKSTNIEGKRTRELYEMAKKGKFRTVEEWIKEQEKSLSPEMIKIVEQFVEQYRRKHAHWMLNEGEKSKGDGKQDKLLKKGFHARFQQLDEKTMQETNEVGSVRLFHLNEETGVWEAKDALSQKTELTIIGKNLFAVKETYQGSYETILYSPDRKIQEMFVRGKDGKYSLMERTDENIDGTRDRQIFDESGKMVEQRVSENWALKKLVRDGKVLFDNTKSTQQKLNNAIKINNGLKR